jgi:hypothetical protein
VKVAFLKSETAPTFGVIRAITDPLRLLAGLAIGVLGLRLRRHAENSSLTARR